MDFSIIPEILKIEDKETKFHLLEMCYHLFQSMKALDNVDEMDKKIGMYFKYAAMTIYAVDKTIDIVERKYRLNSYQIKDKAKHT